MRMRMWHFTCVKYWVDSNLHSFGCLFNTDVQNLYVCHWNLKNKVLMSRLTQVIRKANSFSQDTKIAAGVICRMQNEECRTRLQFNQKERMKSFWGRDYRKLGDIGFSAGLVYCFRVLHSANYTRSKNSLINYQSLTWIHLGIYFARVTRLKFLVSGCSLCKISNGSQGYFNASINRTSLIVLIGNYVFIGSPI